jgi:hypothetical protein
MSLSYPELLIQIGFATLVGGALVFLLWKQRKQAKQLQQKQVSPEKPQHSAQLQLQAYERLILLTERIALPNLINRVNQPGLGVKEMQALLTQNIRQEFDYNITQQIYVSNEAWEAVRNLKDQNLLIINQVASFMPPDATGIDLNKSILEMLVQSPKASLHTVVSEVLSYEAKKLMK